MTHVLWVEALQAGTLVVAGAEGRHAADVRRIRVGEEVDVVDGQGCRGEGCVTAVSKGSLTVEVPVVRSEIRAQPWIVVVQALAKGDRAELAVELCSEVGADEIVPWQAVRSISRWNGDKAERGRSRWIAVARESGKQARRARFIKVSELHDEPTLLARAQQAAAVLVLDPAAAQALADVAVPHHGEVLVIVGPEGGLSGQELRQFDEVGAMQVRMGPSVMRTSGAGATAAAVLLSRTDRWRSAPA